MKYKYCWKGTCNTSKTDSPQNELQRQRALCPVDCQHVFCSLTNFLTDFSEIISILVFSTLTNLTHFWTDHSDIISFFIFSVLTDLTHFWTDHSEIISFLIFSVLTDLTHFWTDHSEIISFLIFSVLTELTHFWTVRTSERPFRVKEFLDFMITDWNGQSGKSVGHFKLLVTNHISFAVPTANYLNDCTWIQKTFEMKVQSFKSNLNKLCFYLKGF